MNLHIREYDPAADADSVRQWMTDRRMHAMWCADRLPFRAVSGVFNGALQAHHERTGDQFFAAADGEDTAVGFFACALHAGEVMMKFIAVDPKLRGQGIGTEMMRLAVQYIFENSTADAVQLMVFSPNSAARKCYERAGFSVREITPEAFSFGGEKWDRINMVIFR